MLGAKELNIKVTWKFQFIEYGTRCHSQQGTFFADVGGKLEMGIVDHHLLNKCDYDSTASAIVDNPHLVLNHLLGPLNETYYKGLNIENRSLIFTFVTHKNPDWDGMVSFFFCDHLVQYGMLPSSQVTNALVHATDMIDQGNARLDGELTKPFIMYNAMFFNHTWDNLLWKGHGLISNIIESKKQITRTTFLEPINCSEKYGQEITDLQSDWEKLECDLADSNVFELFIPNADEGQILVEVLALNKKPVSKLVKYWVRETTNYKVLIVYDKDKSRFIISIDPNTGFSLPCLGYELEQAETIKRAQIGLKRSGSPRFEVEYCNNSDPWYDGRNHGFTIVDSPSQGTILNYEEIISVMRSLYGSDTSKQQPANLMYDAFISYRRSGGTEIGWALKALLEKNGRKVFLDYDSLMAGEFASQLLGSIKKAKCLILILSHGSLDRCRNEDDWIRKEVIAAIENGIVILPLLMAGFEYAEFDNLPEDMCRLKSYHSKTMNFEYFYAVVDQVDKFICSLN